MLRPPQFIASNMYAGDVLQKPKDANLFNAILHDEANKLRDSEYM